MAEIDFDALQREISDAENYLRSAPSGISAMRSSFPAPSVPTATARVSQSAEVTSFASTAAAAAAVDANDDMNFAAFEANLTSDLPAPSAAPGSSGPATPDSMGDPMAAHGGGLSPSAGWGGSWSPAKDSPTQQQRMPMPMPMHIPLPPRAPESRFSPKRGPAPAEGAGKYATEREREKLIARLLAEHGSGSNSSSMREDGANEDRYTTDRHSTEDSPQQRRTDTFNANSVTLGMYGGGNTQRPRSGTNQTDHTADSDLSLDDRSDAGAASNGGGAPSDMLFFASDLGGDLENGTYAEALGFDEGVLGGIAVVSARESDDEFATTWNRTVPQAAANNISSKRPPATTAKAAERRGADTEAEVLARARAASGIPSRLQESSTRDWKYVKSRDDCLREGEKNQKEQYTFKPVLSTKVRKQVQIEPRALIRKGANAHAKSSAANVDQINRRMDETVKKHERGMQNRDKLKKHVEDRERASCSFQPQISKNAHKIIQKREKEERQQQEPDDVLRSSASDRLYAHAKVRAEQQTWIEQQVESARMAEYTFQPLLNPNTKALFERQEKQYGLEHVPIHERVADLQKFKNKRLHDLRAAVEESEEQTLTFAPSIDARSRVLADRNRQADRTAAISEDEGRARNAGTGDVADRLLEEGRASDMRKRQLMTKWEQEQATENAPATLSAGTMNLAQRSGFVGASFAQRQALYQEAVETRAQARQRADADATAEWFHPQIGKSEEIVAASRPDQFVETSSERINRLYREDGQVREYKRAAAEQQVYGDLTFAPTIDPLSRQLARSSTINELVENTKGLAVRDAVRKRVQAEERERCTFKPKVAEYIPEGQLVGESLEGENLYGWDPAHTMNRSMSMHTTASVVASKQTINMHEPEKMAQQIRAQMHAKEERRRQELMGREIDELRECTFAPKVAPPPASNKSLVLIGDQDSSAPIIRGLGRHLELKVLSIRKQEEQQRREAEVFGVPNVDRYRKREDGLTAVKPFALSERDLRPSRAVEDLRMKDESELTFVPVTDMSVRRDAMRGQARAVF